MYDGQNPEAIKAIAPSSLDRYGASDINADLFEIAEKGLLVTYELLQDDEMALEVSTGELLSVEEIAAFGSFLPVQRAYWPS